MEHRRYTVQEKLGVGGMGTVYAAQDRLTGEKVALKRVLISSAKSVDDSTSDFLTALATEFRTLAGLRHPHIVRVIDYGFGFEEGEPQPYFTMEYVPDAKTLTKAASDQPLETQVRLLTEMLMAVAYLHRRGVIHHDLKPDNVLVDRNGRVKVLDFGLAQNVKGKADGAVPEGVMGTMVYMAPELFAEAAASVKSDLYAVGLLIYEIFVERFPYNQENIMQLLSDIMTLVPDMSMLDVEMQELLGRLLAKDPSARLDSADDVIRLLCAATHQPLPPESSAIRESFLQASRFVGRGVEMGQLKSALLNMLAGQDTHIYLIGGESGVGKSRLLDELRTSALVKGAMVLRGQGIAEGGLPFQLWRDIARELALNTELSDLEASILKEIVPDIGTLLNREVADAAQLSDGGGQHRMTLTLVDVLKRQTQPVVLLLEDLQWAESSLAPLKQIMTVRNQFKNLLVAATYRDDERPDLPEIFPDAHTIKLNRLDDASMADLTQSMLGEVGTQPEVLNLLKRETEGNAFFMVETVRALAEDAGALSEIGHRTLPQAVFAGGVGQVIRRRLSRVPDLAHPLLQEMAVAGRWLDLKIMSATRSMEEVNNFLNVCADAGVLEVVEGRWRFSHDKLRETLLRDLSETERRDLHRKVATAIETAYPDDASYHEILLEHWRTVGDSARELHYLVPIVRYLVDISAEFDRAILLANRGLKLASENDKHRPALLNLFAKVKWQMGDYPAALQWAEQSLQAAEKIGDKQGIADSLRTRGQVLTDKGEHALAVDCFQQSMVISRELGDQQGIADNLLTLGIVTYNQGNLSLATDYYQQSMAIYHVIGDQNGIGNNLGNLGNVAESQGDFALAREYAQQAMALFQSIGNRRNVGVCVTNVGNLAYLQGDYAAAIDYLQQGLVISREMGHRLHTAFGLNVIGLIELAKGNLNRASSLLHEALAVADSIDAMPVLLETLVSLARLSLQTEAKVFAAELAGMIEQHPALDEEVRIGEFAKLKQELNAALPVAELATALENGKALDVKAVAKKLLAAKTA